MEPNMEPRDERMALSEEAAQEVGQAHASVVEEFLAPEERLPNVVGLGIGAKIVAGEPTGEPALIVAVSQKLPREALAETALVPQELAGMQTDVLDLGGFPTPAQLLTQRIRPAKGGYSVGHVNNTAGTIATCVYDFLPGASIDPPIQGTGTPRRFHVLSNNHVLANSNTALVGDRIVQPGPIDGGVAPGDLIATLSGFIPITFFPPTPLALHNNRVDAALAVGALGNLDRETYWTGHVRGLSTLARIVPPFFGALLLGRRVQKTGRTTGYTTGTITAVNFTVDVGPYPFGGGTARFVNQIVTTNMMNFGDSGSLLTTYDDLAVGLLFALSSTASFANNIWDVRSLLRVEVGEEFI